MKSKWLYLLAVVAFAFSSCNTDDEPCDTTPTCETVQPTYGELEVKVKTNAENPSIPIAIYYGYVEDGSLYFRDTITGTTTYYVDLDQRYGGTATYKRGSDVIIAVDGDKVSYSSEQTCDVTCYTVKNGSLNLILK